MVLHYLFLLVSFILFTQDSYATVQVFPTRIVMHEKQKISTISVRNKGSAQETYSVKAVFYRMSADGSMGMVDDSKPEERPLMQYIRFSPRQITLGPGQEQVVRIMMKNISQLEDGDYRAHLRILPGFENDKTENEDKTKVNMKVYARVAVSIPVIYYKGDVEIKTQLNDFKVKRNASDPSKFDFSVKIKNLGAAFPAGDFQLYYHPPSGKEVLLSEIKGIASYINERTVSYSFTPEKQVELKQGKIRLVFVGPEHLKNSILAEAETSL